MFNPDYERCQQQYNARMGFLIRAHEEAQAKAEADRERAAVYFASQNMIRNGCAQNPDLLARFDFTVDEMADYLTDGFMARQRR